MVEIVGTLNCYKEDRLVQVSSIQNIDEDDYLMHILKTIDDWSFLEGRQEEASKIQNAEAAMDAKSIAETGRFSSSESLIERAQNFIQNYPKDRGTNEVSADTLRRELRKIIPEGKIPEIIQGFLDTGLVQEDGNLYVIL